MVTIKINISELSQVKCSGKLNVENHLESLPSELSSHVTSAAWLEFKTNVDTIMEEMYQQVRHLAIIENIFKWPPALVLVLYIGWDKLQRFQIVLPGLIGFMLIIGAIASVMLRRKLVSSSEIAQTKLEEELRKILVTEFISFEIENEKYIRANDVRVKFEVEITILGDVEAVQTPQLDVVQTEVEATQIDTGVEDSPNSPDMSSIEFTGIPSSSTNYYGNNNYEEVEPQLVSATIIEDNSSLSGTTKKKGKKCKQCGDLNERGAKFCSNCGSKL